MKSLRAFTSAFIVAFALAMLPCALLAQGDRKPDVTGKWLFNVTTDAGSGTPTVTLQQKGDSLTGHYSSQTFGEADLKGTIKDEKVVFSFRTELQGSPLTVTYSGTLDGNDAMKGTVDFGGMASGTFTARRQ